MVPLGHRQPQRAADRAEHRWRRLRRALLLKPRVVVGRHAGQQRDLFATQPLRAPSRSTGQPDILGLQGFAATAQEVGKELAIHLHKYVMAGSAKPETADPWLQESLFARGRWEQGVVYEP